MINLPVVACTVPALLSQLREKELSYYLQGVAQNTARSYGAAWRIWVSWVEQNEQLCQDRGGSLERPSAGMFTAFISSRAERGTKPQTIAMNLSGIAWIYRQKGYKAPTDDPSVVMVLRGIKREHGAPPVRKAAITPAELARMTSGATSARDRALLLLGFGGAFRRSELTSLRVSDLAFQDDRLVVTLRRSKGDRSGEGVEVVVGRTGNPTCPVAAVERWVRLSGRTGEDMVFDITPDHVARLVKQHARAIGLDSATVAGHSLRAGLITAAVDSGVDAFTVANFARHRDTRVTLGYVRNRAAAGMTGRVGL